MPTTSAEPFTKGNLGRMEIAISSGGTSLRTFGSAILPSHGDMGRITQNRAPGTMMLGVRHCLLGTWDQ